MSDINDERLKRVEARKHNRNLYMTAIYELYEESGEAWVPRPKISERAELSFDKTVEAESYWESQGLVKTVGAGVKAASRFCLMALKSWRITFAV